MSTRGLLAGLVVICLGGCLDPFPGGPQPPDNGADGGGGGADMTTQGGTGIDPAAQHCVDVLNMYRSQAGVAAIKYDATLSVFSTKASQALAAGGAAHQYFIDASQSGTLFSSGFCGGAGENQAPGWAIQPDENGAIDSVLAAMMGEGPGGGHHDAIVSPSYGIVGVGLVVQTDGLWFTNDFSPPCH
jgi:uncharacterized protein YkwD